MKKSYKNTRTNTDSYEHIKKTKHERSYGQTYSKSSEEVPEHDKYLAGLKTCMENSRSFIVGKGTLREEWSMNSAAIKIKHALLVCINAEEYIVIAYTLKYKVGYLHNRVTVYKWFHTSHDVEPINVIKTHF